MSDKKQTNNWLRLRRRTHAILEQGVEGSRASQLFDYFIVFLVLANVLAFLLSTVLWIEFAYRPWLEAFEVFSVVIFTIEYALRIWAAAEFPFAHDEPSWKTRLKYASRPLQLIDLVVIAPFYLSFLFAIDLRMLRVLRLFRLLKLARYSPAMQALVSVAMNAERCLVHCY